jgi:hypothetical protein
VSQITLLCVLNQCISVMRIETERGYLSIMEICLSKSQAILTTIKLDPEYNSV